MQLQCVACVATYLDEARSKESNNDRDHVDRQLKLKELGDAVVDVAAPHHRLDDAREIVVCQDDVRRFLCDVRARDSLHNNNDNRLCRFNYIGKHPQTLSTYFTLALQLQYF